MTESPHVVHLKSLVSAQVDEAEWIREVYVSKERHIFPVLLLAAMLIFAGCGETNSSQSTQGPTPSDQSPGISVSDETSTTSGGGEVITWLQMIGNGELPLEKRADSFEWGLGYLVYYGPIETLGLDNLIYNALRVHKRLATGEVTTANLSQNDQNLLELTEGLEFNPDVDPTEQIAQTPEIRGVILERITPSQEGLSPEEALASNEIIGVIALPSPEDLGGKYLVFTQETPEAEFVFLGVIVVADAIIQEAATTETYSFQGWEDLPYLGDAAGPFWNHIPAGVSGDPTNTAEGRPGVLLISESKYEEIKQGNFE